ncbi:MAG: hypothetical protein Q4G26_13385 [Paracoccus sp. (in: a-proteobacteria)]|nr:hypothetical protein [Paracoccus sp. (in: a-proteobacteria)]
MGLAGPAPETPDPKEIRRSQRLWWINIIAAFGITALSGSGSVLLWLLGSGVVTQSAPLDGDEYGLAVVLGIVAVVFLVLGVTMLRRMRRMTPQEWHEKARNWRSPL